MGDKERQDPWEAGHTIQQRDTWRGTMGDKTLGKAEHQGGHLKKASRTLNSTLFGQKQKPTSNLKARITNEIPPPLFLIGTCRSRKKLEPSKMGGKQLWCRRNKRHHIICWSCITWKYVANISPIHLSND
jgi:hypothetical protein